jgi:carboxyl-terminal processing protease
VLRTREADLEKHLGNNQGAAAARNTALEAAREAARKRAEEEARKPPSERTLAPEFGGPKDFQLIQAINHLKGRPVVVSKTQVIASKDQKKEN